MKLAKRIDVIRNGTACRLAVDGEDFPWYTGAQGWDVQVHYDECPSVTVTLLAEHINLVNTLTSPRFAVDSNGVAEVTS